MEGENGSRTAHADLHQITVGYALLQHSVQTREKKRILDGQQGVLLEEGAIALGKVLLQHEGFPIRLEEELIIGIIRIDLLSVGQSMPDAFGILDGKGNAPLVLEGGANRIPVQMVYDSMKKLNTTRVEQIDVIGYGFKEVYLHLRRKRLGYCGETDASEYNIRNTFWGEYIQRESFRRVETAHLCS